MNSGVLFFTVIGLTCAMVVATGFTLAATPTAEQIQMFEQMSPEQRTAALELLRKQGGGLQTQQPLEQPLIVKPRVVGSDSAVEQHTADAADVATLAEDSASQSVNQQLKQFGYDLFAGAPTTFAPATDIPIPADYVVGPGDTVQVQLFGKDNVQHNLVVTREGELNFPGIGPISVAGQRFARLREDLQNRVSRQMIGVKASITMGPLRSMRIFVLGDVFRPGSYLVSGLSTMSHALFVSGGIRLIGSLRDVQLKRRGKIVQRMDLYDLLLSGDTSADTRLLPGDVIFVPPIGRTVGVGGEVRRPAIYELKDEKSVGDVLHMAGGTLPTAYPEAVQLERINSRRERTLVDLDLSKAAGVSAKVKDGDVLRIYSVLERMEDIVLVSGHVDRPGGYQWRKGLRISDLIASVNDLLPRPELDYAVVKRELLPDRRLEIISTQLGRAIAHPSSADNLTLEPRDELIVFGLAEDRAETLKPVIKQLRQQARAQDPERVSVVNGNVMHPGEYPLEGGMRVSDLIRAGGGLNQQAYILEAEITRFDIVAGKFQQIAHIGVDLAQALAGDLEANFPINPQDHLTIKQLPKWGEREYVDIGGEVRFPGRYPISKGETLGSVLMRAGGLTELAFADGAVFTRKELRAKEQEQLDKLAKRLEADIAAATVQRTAEGGEQNQQQALAAADELLKSLQSSEAVGRMVINFPTIVAAVGEDQAVKEDIVLKHEDKLIVPSFKQEVSVLGEVFFPTSHIYQEHLRKDDYIRLSGGMTRRGDHKLTYVVHANGAVIGGKKGFFRFLKKRPPMKPGDTIVVPIDVDRVRPLALWTSVSQIVYQLALAAASANAVGVF